MRAAREMVLTAIDFEGTGAVRGYVDEPWQIGLVQICAGQVNLARMHESFLHVGDRPFNPYAPGRHALVRDALKQAPTLSSLWPDLKPYMHGLPLVAHNIATERRYLTRAFPMHIPAIWLDTLTLSRLAYPALPSYKLEDVLTALALNERVLRLLPGREAHDALYDAVGCAVLFCHLLAQPGWRDATVDDLVLLHKRAPQR